MSDINNGFKLSQHALRRLQQRGIRNKEVIPFIIQHGSRVNSHGDNKSFINKKRLNHLQIRGYKEFISKNDKHIRSTVVVWKGNTIITVFKVKGRIRWN